MNITKLPCVVMDEKACWKGKLAGMDKRFSPLCMSVLVGGLLLPTACGGQGGSSHQSGEQTEEIGQLVSINKIVPQKSVLDCYGKGKFLCRIPGNNCKWYSDKTVSVSGIGNTSQKGACLLDCSDIKDETCSSIPYCDITPKCKDSGEKFVEISVKINGKIPKKRMLDCYSKRKTLCRIPGNKCKWYSGKVTFYNGLLSIDGKDACLPDCSDFAGESCSSIPDCKLDSGKCKDGNTIEITVDVEDEE